MAKRTVPERVNEYIKKHPEAYNLLLTDIDEIGELGNTLDKLEEVQSTLSYYDKPVKEVSRLHMNASGRYETGKGHYYTSGSCIEFMRVEEVYNSDTGKYEDMPIWTTSRVEHDGQDYYIVAYRDVGLSGLNVRVRD